MRKRTIDRKASKEATLNRVARGLAVSNGTNGAQRPVNGNGHAETNGQGGDKGEFDDLISALRAGDVFGEDLVKMRRNRRRLNGPDGSPHRTSQTNSTTSIVYSRENSRERALSRKAT